MFLVSLTTWIKYLDSQRQGSFASPLLNVIVLDAVGEQKLQPRPEERELGVMSQLQESEGSDSQVILKSSRP